MPKYTMRYFDAKAMGECIRLLLAAAGEEFQDVRVTWEQWPDIKASTPFGYLPTLEVDGTVYSQSKAIARYLGKELGLSGATSKEELQIDQIVDTFDDLRENASSAHYESCPEHQERKYKEAQPLFAPLLEKLDAAAEANGGHVALGKLTWGDFVVAGMYEYLKMMLRMDDLDTKYPAIKRIEQNVYALPKVQAYVSKRPPIDIPY